MLFCKIVPRLLKLGETVLEEALYPIIFDIIKTFFLKFPKSKNKTNSEACKQMS